MLYRFIYHGKAFDCMNCGRCNTRKEVSGTNKDQFSKYQPGQDITKETPLTRRTNISGKNRKEGLRPHWIWGGSRGLTGISKSGMTNMDVLAVPFLLKYMCTNRGNEENVK